MCGTLFWCYQNTLWKRFSINIQTVILLFQEKRSKTVINSLSQAVELISPPALFRFDGVKNLSKVDLKSLKQLGYIYFVYLFIYSGLEFTVTFLMYHKFHFTSIDQAKMFLMTGKFAFYFIKRNHLNDFFCRGCHVIASGIGSPKNSRPSYSISRSDWIMFNCSIVHHYWSSSISSNAIFRNVPVLSIYCICGHLLNNFSFEIWKLRSKRYRTRNF